MLPQKLGHQIFPNFSLKSSYGNPKKIYIRETHTKPLHAMTEYAKNVIEQNKRTQNPTLDLGNCGLTELPDLSGMDWVDTLILSTLWSEYDDTKQEWIIYESQHNISNNRFENTQGSRIELPMLKKLIASGTEIQHCIIPQYQPNQRLSVSGKVDEPYLARPQLQPNQRLSVFGKIDEPYLAIPQYQPNQRLSISGKVDEPYFATPQR
jgi:hypothetical protein